MIYKYETKAKERVELDRSLVTGRVKVYVDGKLISPSHRGVRGATGTYYQVRSGTLEIRSGFFELVPRLWYNEDWVELVAPIQPWQYLLAALPFAVALPFLLEIYPLIFAFIAFVANIVVLQSQRSRPFRVAVCVGITVADMVVTIAFPTVVNMLTHATA